jgi:hypothetical protein
VRLCSIGEAQGICLDADELTIGESTGFIRRLTGASGIARAHGGRTTICLDQQLFVLQDLLIPTDTLAGMLSDAQLRVISPISRYQLIENRKVNIQLDHGHRLVRD